MGRRKRVSIEASDLQDYIEKYNPLALRDNEKKLMYFSFHSECYLYFLEWLFKKCSRGFIDPLLMLMDLYDLDNSEAMSIAGVLKAKRYILSDPLLVMWARESDTVMTLRRIIQGLCYYTECTFEEPSFIIALDEFFKVDRIKVAYYE